MSARDISFRETQFTGLTRTDVSATFECEGSPLVMSSELSELLANEMNTLKYGVPLPLMENEDSAMAYHSWGIHTVVVPSNEGGRLRVGIRGARAELRELTLLLKAANGAEASLVRSPASWEARIDFAPGTRGADGRCTALVHANAPGSTYEIYAIFEDAGFARSKDGHPSIPWNFWYFPFAHDADGNAFDNDVLAPLQRYEAAFDVRGAFDWELAHHGDPYMNRAEWEGHCHFASIASILFEPPPVAGVTHNDVLLLCEEVKFLATEFAGSFVLLGLPWSLPEENDRKKDGDFHEKKPNENSTKFARWDVLGQLLVVLRQRIRDDGQMLTMDLRDPDAHEAIWNFAVYRYTTRYWQLDVDVPTRCEGETTLFANAADLPDPKTGSTGSPVKQPKQVNGEWKFENQGGGGQERVLRYQMDFGTGGSMNTLSPDNRWWSVKRRKVSKVKFYAPRHAMSVERLLEPGVRNIENGGNPHIQRDHILGLLKLRDRFA